MIVSVKEIIEKRLEEAFKPSSLELIDVSYEHAGHKTQHRGAMHFKLNISSKQFKSVSPLQRQRLILNTIKDLMPMPVHSITMNVQEG
ncbi:MAG: BolA/IbaG family iron-sulfur metabolism protein [Chlamydiales bacterium]|nr:BolA family transcriptional regulator [Chlamydiales bacterium]NCF70065.1 BolA/IbaG family iron-sulfur metabolism protein [Chlamydiales bacterium]